MTGPAYVRASRRELEVLRELLWDGADNMTIALRLRVSRDTVKTHIANLFIKAGVSNRTALVINICRGHIIVLDPQGILSDPRSNAA